MNSSGSSVIEPFAKIKVIGVGGGGTNAVNRMIEAGLAGVDFWAMNTDIQVLITSSADRTLQLGENLTKGLGAGGNPEIGRASADESKSDIKKALVGHPVEILECAENPCEPFTYNGQTSIPPNLNPVYVMVSVRSAVIRGVGTRRVFADGSRRYQRFEVNICAVDYTAGGARVSADVLWHTRRPPSTTKTASGGIGHDSGAPYAEDWEYRGLSPLAHDGC